MGGNSHRSVNPGSNVPASLFDRTAIYIESKGEFDATNNFWWAGYYGNMIRFGEAQPNLNGPAERPALRPREAMDIDTKMDDGKPASGILFSMKNSYHGNCTTTNIQSTTEYDATYDGKACTLEFIQVF